MECPSCAFQNTPGMRNCVRCQGLLDFSGIAVDPPRAASSAIVRRGRAMAFRFRLGARERRTRYISGLSIGMDIPGAGQLVPWAAVPGLPQIRAGAPSMGWTILVVWVALLILAVLMVGSGMSLLLLAAAGSVHCFGVTLFLAGAMQSMPIFRRMATGLAIYGVLLVGVYLPARYLLTSTVGVIRLPAHASSDLLQARDVLLCTGPWTRPDAWERGMLVVYSTPGHSMSGVVINSGQIVDRIVGLPGDTVEIRHGTTYVNGERLPREQGPVFPHRLPELVVTAGPGEYVVIPSGMHILAIGQPGIYAQATGGIVWLAGVPEERLVGRVLWRLRPWKNAGPL
jgi:signal peptidase I